MWPHYATIHSPDIELTDALTHALGFGPHHPSRSSTITTRRASTASCLGPKSDRAELFNFDPVVEPAQARACITAEIGHLGP
jgi:hypothetical protein